MTRTRLLALATSLSILAACGSSPQVNFHNLSVAAGPSPPPPPAGRSVQVAAVHVSPSLNRRQMVTQTGPHDVEISDRDRWAAPLGPMARRVLSQDLQSRLGEGTVVMPDIPASPETAQIVVSLLQFGPEASGKAVLVGSWSLLDGRTGDVRLRRDVSFDTALSGPGGDAAAAAMSDLLGQLAASIATALRESNPSAGDVRPRPAVQR